MSLRGMRPAAAKPFICRRAFWGSVATLFLAVDAAAQDTPAQATAASASSYGFLFIGCLCLFLAWCVGTLRWKWILDASGLHLKYGFLLQTWVAADFLNRLVPFVFPIPRLGAAYRFAQIARVSRQGSRSAVVIAIEKMCGLVSLAALFAVLFPIALIHLEMDLARLRVLAAGAALLVAFTILAASLLRPQTLWSMISLVVSPRKIRPTLANVLNAFSVFEGKTLKVAQIVLLGVVLHGLTILYLGFLVYAVATSDIGWVTSSMTSVLDLFLPLSEWFIAQAQPEAFSERMTRLRHQATVEAAQAIGLVVLSGVSGTYFAVQLYRLVLVKPESVEVRNLYALVQDHRLTLEAARAFRRYLAGISAAALGGGLIGGALVGLSEGLWVVHLIATSQELGLLWWGPLVYGPIFAPFGLAVGWAAGFLGAATDKRPSAPSTCVLAMAGTLAACVVVFGRFRYLRDVLGEGVMNTGQGMAILGSALALGLLVALAGLRLLGNVHFGPKRGVLTVFACYAAVIVLGGVLGRIGADPTASSEEPPAPGLDAPNVIFIVADTLRADYLRMYSSGAKAETPRLDELRRDAVQFENFFAQAPWTKPAFGSMFTGLYPTEHRLIGKASTLPQDVETLTERLLRAGYYTQGFPNNSNIIRAYGFAKGFVGYEYLAPNMPFFSTPSAAHLEIYQVLRRLRARLQLPRVDIDSFYQPAPVVNETVMDWIDRESPSKTPFFLFFHYMDTHDPYISADTTSRGYAMLHLGLHPDLNEYGDPMREAYIDEIERIDRHCGEIMDFLKSKGLYKDSLILFVADHGEEFYDHGGWWHALTHYDEMLHVPLLMKLPGNKRGGETNSFYGSQIDLAPTILKVLGLPVSERMSGGPLLNAEGDYLNKGASHAYAESDFLGAKIWSLRGPKMKIIRARPGPERELKTVELFDLSKDPAELRDIAGTGNPKEADLQERLDEMRQKLQDARRR